MDQITINTLIATCIYALSALGFATIYQSIRFFHFAHAAIFAFGAYFTFLFSMVLGWSLYITIPFAIMLSLLLGGLTERIIYKTFRQRKTNSIVLLLTSLGIYILLQNSISILFGDDIKSMRTWEVKVGLKVFEVYIAPVQIMIVAVSILLLILIIGYLIKNKRGRAMRAVANDPELAKLSGIKSDNIILLSFTIGSALAGIAGILVALDIDMTPNMGMNMLLMGVVAMIIGGVGSIWGIVFGSLLLAFAQNIGVWYLSSQWQDAIAFGILLIFLLFKPEGFFGKKLRKTEV